MGTYKIRSAAILIAATFVCCGCGVDRIREENYIPASSARNVEYYGCLKDAQQFQARGAISANAYGAVGGTRASSATNRTMLASCMRSNGYQLRSLTKFEIVTDVITFPFALLSSLLGDPPDDFW